MTTTLTAPEPVSSDLGRVGIRLLTGADDVPRSLDDVLVRAGYSRNDARPFWRIHANQLVESGYLAPHAPTRTGRYPRYSRTVAGITALRAALEQQPALAPLTALDPETGRPLPIPGDLTPAGARLLLAFAEGGTMTLSRAIRAAGYQGDVTTWYRRELRNLTCAYLVAAHYDDEAPDSALYVATPAGITLAGEIGAGRPELPDLDATPQGVTA